MVRIVHEVPLVTKRCTCGNCGVTLEYTNTDIKQHSTPDYTGMDYTRGLKCPSCKTIITRY